MAKNLEISQLSDVYGGLLTDRKREFLEYYYDEDMSLGEIAEITGISRQGVRDAVKHAEEQLYKAEERLGFIKRDRLINEKLGEIISCADAIMQENLNTGLSREINDLTVKIKTLCSDILDSDSSYEE